MSKEAVRLLAMALAALCLLSLAAAAHGEEDSAVRLDETIRQNTLQFILWGTAALVGLVGLSAFIKRRGKKGADMPAAIGYPVFFLIIAIILGVTAYVAGSTVYLNVISPTGGPVHWHADFEIWNCGQPVDLIDPTGLSNRVGDPVLHEHGDNRIHLEGVVVSYEDITLSRFFDTVGGDFHTGELVIPTNSGDLMLMDGDLCNGEPGTLQVFVYKDLDGVMVQQKLTNYEDYVISPFGQVPPGDCFIVELDSEVKPSTEHLCESYEVALKRGKISGGGANGG